MAYNNGFNINAMIKNSASEVMGIRAYNLPYNFSLITERSDELNVIIMEAVKPNSFRFTVAFG